MGHRGICICQNSARLAHSSICQYYIKRGKKWILVSDIDIWNLLWNAPKTNRLTEVWGTDRWIYNKANIIKC